MKNLIIRKSLYLNIFLLLALGFLNYKMGVLDSVLAAGHPTAHNFKDKSVHLLKDKFKNSQPQTNQADANSARVKGDLATEVPVVQNSQKIAKASLTPQLTDTLSSTQWWQDNVKAQLKDTANRQYSGCVFGDSISSGLGNTLGDRNFNFALSGMSTVSLIEQLNILNSSHVKCDKAIVAIGTNDALYSINDAQFVQNLKQTIAKVKAMGATKVVLIPAFYSTLAASLDPSMAGTIDRVEEINALIRQVAQTENVPIEGEATQPLFEGQTLKESLTVDGVHLNDNGKKIYKQALLKELNPS